MSRSRRRLLPLLRTASESLETRALLSTITFTDGEIEVKGTSGADNVEIDIVDGDVRARVNAVTRIYPSGRSGENRSSDRYGR